MATRLNSHHIIKAQNRYRGKLCRPLAHASGVLRWKLRK